MHSGSNQCAVYGSCWCSCSANIISFQCSLTKIGSFHIFLNLLTHTSSEEELTHMFKSVNGILFPGGGSDLRGTQLYKAGRFLVELALKANQAGDYFPVQGHCMG